MKYFSEITNKTYDTEEELVAAEKSFEKQKKENNLENDGRKLAAQKVDEALNKVAQVRAENKTKEDAINEKLDQISEKYRQLFKEVEEKYRAEERELEEKQRSEEKELHEELKKNDKQLSDTLTAARKEMSEFCKKYGAYHYSVNAKNSDIFPFLWGIRQTERFQNAFDLFGGLWERLE